jgi:sarcosine oxidase gamma subunit
MDVKGPSGKPGFVVFRQVGPDQWQLVGEAERRPGQTARKARAEAIADATGGKADGGETYAAVLRSEWRIALDY